MRSEEFMLMTNPLTPAGVEPATFRFVAQHLNHSATAVPTIYIYGNVFPFHRDVTFQMPPFRPAVSYLRVLVTNLPTSRLQQSLFPRPAQLQVRHYDHLSAIPQQSSSIISHSDPHSWCTVWLSASVQKRVLKKMLRPKI